jgi:hypothetical protein
MYVIKNRNAKTFKVNGVTVHGSLQTGARPTDVTRFTEDAKQYKSVKGARVAILRLKRELTALVKAGAVTSRSKDLSDALPDYTVVVPKGKTM